MRASAVRPSPRDDVELSFCFLSIQSPQYPINMAHYGQPSYWEGRYTKDAEPFDWLQRYSAPLLRELINAHIPRDGAILMSGCGSSTMSEDMVDDGYVGGIANVDISRTVVDDLADRLKSKKGLSCAFVVASVDAVSRERDANSHLSLSPYPHQMD